MVKPFVYVLLLTFYIPYKAEPVLNTSHDLVGLPSGDICREYYERVCRDWARNNYDAIKSFYQYRDVKRITMAHIWENEIADALIDMLKREIGANDSVAVIEAKVSYNTCLGIRPIKMHFDPNTLLRLIKRFQIDVTSTEPRLELNRILRNLTANFDFSPLVQSGVSKGQNSEKNIKLNPHLYPQLLIFTKIRLQTKPIYETFMKRALTRLDELFNGTEVVDDGERRTLFLYESSGNQSLNHTIDDIVRSVLSIDEEAHNNTRERIGSETLPISDLQAKYSFLDWVSYFNAAFEAQNLTFDQDSNITVYEVQYMIIWNDLILRKLQSSQGIIDLQRYVVWSFLEKLMYRLPEQFDDIRIAYYAASLNQSQEKPIKIAKVYECLNAVAKTHESTLAHMFYSLKNDEDLNSQVMHLVTNIHQKILFNVESFEWGQSGLKAALVNIINNVSYALETSLREDNDIPTANSPQNENQNLDLIATLLRNLKALRQKYIQKGPDDYHKWYLHSLLATKAVIDPNPHLIKLPIALITSLNKDPATRLGQLASIITDAIRNLIRHEGNVMTSTVYINFTRALAERIYNGHLDEKVIDKLVYSFIKVNGSHQVFKSFTEGTCRISAKRLDDYLVGNFTYTQNKWWDYPIGITNVLSLVTSQDPNRVCNYYLNP